MKKFLLILLLLLGNVCFSADVVVLHTSDVHGRISPVEYRGKSNEGGFSRRVTFVNDIRSKNKNVLLLDSGDYFQGSLYYRMDLGKSSAKLLPYIKYDAIVLGNHEFDNGIKVLKRNIKLSKTQFISSNIHFKDKYLQKAVKPYIIKEFDGEKYLIIGVTTPDLASLSIVDDVEVTQPVDEIKKIISEVNNYDKLIVVSHCGMPEDKAIAEAIPQIDVILAGHNHLFFKNPYFVGKTSIMQDGEFGIRVGVTHIDKKREFSSKYITEEIKSNELVDKKISKIDKHNKKAKNKIVAKTDITLIGNQDDIERNQTNLGKLVLISMAKDFKDYDVVLTNSGSIRVNRNLRGDITYADLLEILPFDNDVVMLETTGKNLKQILKIGKEYGRKYLQVYLKTDNIEDDKIYKVITNSYIADGKDGYEDFKNAKEIKKSSKSAVKLLKETLQDMKTVTEDKL